MDKLLGGGGMGSVFLATHVRLGRQAAVKVLDQRLASDEQYCSRFFREARIVNDVRHPNIVDIIDFIETNDPRRVAYVMEYLDGPSLGSILKMRALSVRQAINVQLQLAGALEVVHGLGVVHRDLKPDNLILVEPLDTDLSRSPSIKILDFGIAKMINAPQHKTATGAILGTPLYMAPEQVAGLPVSSATDVYALAEILYESLTAKRVFAGNNIQVLKAKLDGAPQFTLSDIPLAVELTSLISSCLVVDPEARPTLSAYAGELTNILMRLEGDVAADVPRPLPIQKTMGADATLITGSTPKQMPETPPASNNRKFAVAGVAAFVVAAGIFYLAQPRQPELPLKQEPSVAIRTSSAAQAVQQVVPVPQPEPEPEPPPPPPPEPAKKPVKVKKKPPVPPKIDAGMIDDKKVLPWE